MLGSTRLHMLALITASCMLLVLCTSCNKQDTQQPAPGHKSAAKGKPAADSAAASLFTGTRVEGVEPDSLDLSRDGQRIVAKFPAPDSNDILAAAFNITESGLGDPKALLSGRDLIRAYIAAAPTTAEALVISNAQEPGGPVLDVLWRAAGLTRQAVPYNTAESFPADGPQDMCFGLRPFFSWDGTQVVVPLNAKGLVVVTIKGNQARYVAYPEFPQPITGMAFGPVPDSDNRNRIYVSIWSVGQTPELCRVQILDLDSLQWTGTADLDWVVYQVASPDVDNLPWVVRGSRAPRTNTEHQRIPRLAMVDPISGAVDLKEFFGEPVWETALDPHGTYVVYMDAMRHALVRAEVETGALAADQQIFDENAKLFVSDGCRTVLVWNKTTLQQARFTDLKSELEPVND